MTSGRSINQKQNLLSPKLPTSNTLQGSAYEKANRKMKAFQRYLDNKNGENKQLTPQNFGIPKSPVGKKGHSLSLAAVPESAYQRGKTMLKNSNSAILPGTPSEAREATSKKEQEEIKEHS